RSRRARSDPTRGADHAVAASAERGRHRPARGRPRGRVRRDRDRHGRRRRAPHRVRRRRGFGPSTPGVLVTTLTRELRSDELEVVVLPYYGARVHSIRAFGELVTHTPSDHDQHLGSPFNWGGYHMVPWCNRLPPAPVDVIGRTVDLTPNFADGTAIHGFHVTSKWREDDGTFIEERSGDRHWPWTYVAGVTYRVE